MTKEYQKTLCDIDIILNNISKEEKNKVPIKLQKFIHDNKLEGYESSIDTNIPIENQKLSEETTAFIGMLYLKYWCQNEEEKENLKSVVHQNELDYQKKLNEKYSYENLFKNSRVNDVAENNTKEEVTQTSLIEYKESIIKKIWEKIKSFFRR